MEPVVLHRVWFSEYFCPKQGQDFKPSVAPIYPYMGKVSPSGTTTFHNLTTENLTGPILSLSTEISIWNGHNGEFKKVRRLL